MSSATVSRRGPGLEVAVEMVLDEPVHLDVEVLDDRRQDVWSFSGARRLPWSAPTPMAQR